MRLLILLCLLISFALRSQAQQAYSAADNDVYGYTASMPIPMKSKGQLHSLHHAEDFIKHLLRDNGEPLLVLSHATVRDPNYTPPTAQSTNKLGIPVKDKAGWIDVFTVSGSQVKDTVLIYVDIYHSGDAKVPRGLKYVP